MRPSPFVLIPWEQNFLPSLLKHVLLQHEGKLSQTFFIFPHQRALKYFNFYLRAEKNIPLPSIFPQTRAVNVFFEKLHQGISQKNFRQINLLDQVGLLMQCVRRIGTPKIELSDEESLPFEPTEFFPWGVRLAELFEECFIAMRRPENFIHLCGQALPYAARLLRHLADIFAAYTEALDKNAWTTPGRICQKTAEHFEKGYSLPNNSLHGKSIYIAGFYSPTAAEDIVFKRLWQEHHAQIVVHADPALLQNDHSCHWACEIIHAWARKWKIGFQAESAQSTAILEKQTQADFSQNKIYFYEGFDLHSQLNALQDALPRTDQFSTESTEEPDGEFSAPAAIVLPDSGLLLPVLHHLPQQNCNISMGYPLDRSPFFQLLDTLLQLQEKRRGRRYYWRDLIKLFRHPYLKMLSLGGRTNPISSCTVCSEPKSIKDPLQTTVHGPTVPHEAGLLRNTLHRMEEGIRNAQQSFLDPLSLLDSLAANSSPQEFSADFIRRIIMECISSLENVQTSFDLGNALEAFCLTLLHHTQDLWNRFPIDAQCLHQFLKNITPELKHSAMSQEIFPQETIFNLTRQLIQAARVPFTAAPLKGLQVLGLLETRLLSFRKVFVLNATDDILPGSPAHNPLLPESLRAELGLPASKIKTAINAYHFFRLLAGAEQSSLFWQEGIENPFEYKKQKSRFIEELLWEREKHEGKLLSDPDSQIPYQILGSAMLPAATTRPGVSVTPALREFILKRLAPNISASLLNAYLRCPVQFLYENILTLQKTLSVSEKGDPPAIGTLLHLVLHQFYSHRIGKQIQPDADNATAQASELLATFTSCLEQSPLADSLPTDALLILQSAAQVRLPRFLDKQPVTMPIALEVSLQSSLPTELGQFTLHGRIDRIDLRENGLFILDYKTGEIPRTSKSIWNDTAFWANLEQWQPSDCPKRNNALFHAFSDAFPSIQLPLYLFLLQLNQEQKTGRAKDWPSDAALWNAGFISLGGDGEEHLLFSEQLSCRERSSCVTSLIPRAITFLLRHILCSPAYSPKEGRHCSWCSIAGICQKSK